ncbi:MAG: MFS transporter [Dehalococcoidales bacterium]|nr:MFS transporter [Dehalococcoidales bacterium]
MKFIWAKSKDKKEPSLTLFHAEAGSGSVENAAIAYQSQSVIAAGANGSGVALLSSLTNLFLSVFLLKVPSLIEGPKTSTRRTVVILALANTATWIPIVLVMMLFTHVHPLMLTALWIINIVPTVLLGPLRDYWIANIVPTDKMGRYLSWRSVISGAAYLLTFYIMGIILETNANKNLFGFAVILLFALFASAASAFLYTRIKPPVIPESKTKPAEFGFLTFLKQARSSHLGVFILFVSMFTFATNLAGPLFASYMMDELKFGYMTFAAVVSFEFIARVISLTFWGKMVDKTGSLKVLSMVAYLIPIVPVLWLFSTNIAYLCMIQAFSGVVWAAFDLSVQTFIYKATSPEQRLRYIVYYKSLTSFSVALGALTGALLVNNIVPIFGSKILTLFLLSGILRMVVARIMLPKLTTEGIPGAVIHEELANELSAAEMSSYAGGLYYHPEAWGKFTRRAYIIGNNIGKTLTRLNPVKAGLFYQTNEWSKYNKTTPKTHEVSENPKALYTHPNNWADYMRQQGADLQPIMAETKTSPAREGLYYRKAEWAQPDAMTDKARQAAQIEKKGLFHNPEQWLDYLKQGAALNATTMQSTTGTSSRQPVYYHPEAWEKYKQETAGNKSAQVKHHTARQPLLYHPEDWKRFSAENVKPYHRKPAVNHRVPVKPVPVTIKRDFTAKPRRTAAVLPVARKLQLEPVVTRY